MVDYSDANAANGTAGAEATNGATAPATNGDAGMEEISIWLNPRIHIAHTAQLSMYLVDSREQITFKRLVCRNRVIEMASTSHYLHALYYNPNPISTTISQFDKAAFSTPIPSATDLNYTYPTNDFYYIDSSKSIPSDHFNHGLSDILYI